MTPSEFIAFVAPAAEGMAHLRIIRYVWDDISHDLFAKPTLLLVILRQIAQ